MSGKISDNLGTASGLVKSATDAPDSGSSDPTVSTNPSAAGDRFINTTSGELFVCIDATAGSNKWRGQLGTEIDPPTAEQGGRGLWAGGSDGSYNIIDYVAIGTTGNATDFGDQTQERGSNGATSNGSRAIFGGGYKSPAVYDVIDYITIATTGDATDFGDISSTRGQLPACSDGTKGVFWGGSDADGRGKVNSIEYVNIASTGDVTDFGDMNSYRDESGATSNGTRGVVGGGGTGADIAGHVVRTNEMEYITIASTGNSSDFGDLATAGHMFNGACSDLTKGLWAGHHDGSYSDIIEYVNIASLGNASDFGNLTQARQFLGSCSNGTRGVFGGGYHTSGHKNEIDYVIVASLGNATDFGDLTQARDHPSSTAGD